MSFGHIKSYSIVYCSHTQQLTNLKQLWTIHCLYYILVHFHSLWMKRVMPKHQFTRVSKLDLFLIPVWSRIKSAFPSKYTPYCHWANVFGWCRHFMKMCYEDRHFSSSSLYSCPPPSVVFLTNPAVSSHVLLYSADTVAVSNTCQEQQARIKHLK